MLHDVLSKLCVNDVPWSSNFYKNCMGIIHGIVAVTLAAQCEIPPIPFRDSIAEAVSHARCLVFVWYRASIAEIPSCARGISPQVRMLG